MHKRWRWMIFKLDWLVAVGQHGFCQCQIMNRPTITNVNPVKNQSTIIPFQPRGTFRCTGCYTSFRSRIYRPRIIFAEQHLEFYPRALIDGRRMDAPDRRLALLKTMTFPPASLILISQVRTGTGNNCSSASWCFNGTHFV